jgi:hypothetical protein
MACCKSSLAFAALCAGIITSDSCECKSGTMQSDEIIKMAAAKQRAVIRKGPNLH